MARMVSGSIDLQLLAAEIFGGGRLKRVYDRAELVRTLIEKLECTTRDAVRTMLAMERAGIIGPIEGDGRFRLAKERSCNQSNITSPVTETTNQIN